jgi:phenylacetate-CoA ligase
MAVTVHRATPEVYAASFDAEIAGVLPEAVRRAPGLAARLAGAGVAVEDLTDVASLDRIPVLTKDALLDLQQADPPFAGLLAEDAVVRRVFQSPGPLYEPELSLPDAWRWAPALRAAGFSADDLVINCFGYHLSPAGAMFESAIHAIGARVIPAGVGNVDLQARACADLGATAYVGLPSYLNRLLDEAQRGGHALSLRRAFVSAEPLPASLRQALMARIPVVQQGYGTAETGNLGYESHRRDGLHVPADALVQICDLATGEAIYDDREGQVVVTVLRPDYPVVRFGTGDLSAWAAPVDDEPEPTPRIRGWLGRVGDAIKVRGMFLHPRQIHAVMGDVPGTAAYRFVIERADHRDVLRCEVAADDSADRGTLAARVAGAVRDGLRFSVAVEVVDALAADGAVIDDRRRWD